MLKKQIYNNIIKFILLGLIWSFYSCENDDKYHYSLSYRINNQTPNLQSGILFLDSNYYSDPSIAFKVEAGQTIELFTGDGGDGSKETPPDRQGLLAMKEIHLNIEESIFIIDVEEDEKWVYTTEKSTGIYTYTITEYDLNP